MRTRFSGTCLGFQWLNSHHRDDTSLPADLQAVVQMELYKRRNETGGVDNADRKLLDHSVEFGFFMACFSMLPVILVSHSLSRVGVFI